MTDRITKWKKTQNDLAVEKKQIGPLVFAVSPVPEFCFRQKEGLKDDNIYQNKSKKTSGNVINGMQSLPYLLCFITLQNLFIRYNI